MRDIYCILRSSTWVRLLFYTSTSLNTDANIALFIPLYFKPLVNLRFTSWKENIIKENIKFWCTRGFEAAQCFMVSCYDTMKAFIFLSVKLNATVSVVWKLSDILHNVEDNFIARELSHFGFMHHWPAFTLINGSQPPTGFTVPPLFTELAQKLAQNLTGRGYLVSMLT